MVAVHHCGSANLLPEVVAQKMDLQGQTLYSFSSEFTTLAQMWEGRRCAKKKCILVDASAPTLARSRVIQRLVVGLELWVYLGCHLPHERNAYVEYRTGSCCFQVFPHVELSYRSSARP